MYGLLKQRLSRDPEWQSCGGQMHWLTSMRRVNVRQTRNARTPSHARPHCMPVTA